MAIKRDLTYSVVVRRELSKKSKALNFRYSLCPFSPTVSLYGHETSVMIKRVQSQVQASKMRFLRKIEGVTSLTRCTSVKIRKSQEPLFLQNKRSQLKIVWSRKQNASGKTAKQALLAKADEKKR